MSQRTKTAVLLRRQESGALVALMPEEPPSSSIKEAKNFCKAYMQVKDKVMPVDPKQVMRTTRAATPDEQDELMHIMYGLGYIPLPVHELNQEMLATRIQKVSQPVKKG